MENAVICPSDEMLRSILDQPNRNSEMEDVDSHLAGCSICQVRINQWGETSKLQAIGEGVPSVPASTSQKTPFGVPTQSNSTDTPTVSCQQPALRRIGQYLILREIGRGGGGEVFEATHLALQKSVAIKLLRDQDTADETLRRRFFREMQSIGRLNHPHIVQAYDAGESEGTLYIAMELVTGENVRHLINRMRQLNVPDACEIIRQAALGLQHAHEHGLVHRDIKPSNLLISPTGVKIADMGLAFFQHASHSDGQITGSYSVLGTPDYMAPEQAEDPKSVDIRADLYSLGCTLFDLLTGRAPYARPENDSILKKLKAHATEAIPNVLELRPDIPRGLAGVLEILLAKDRNQRFATPGELVEAISPFCRPVNLIESLQAAQTDPPLNIATAPPSRLEHTTSLLAGESAWKRMRLFIQSGRSPRSVLAFIAILLIAPLTAIQFWPATFNQSRLSEGPYSMDAGNRSPRTEDGHEIFSSDPLAESTPVANPSSKSVTQIGEVIPPKVAPPLGTVAQQWQKTFGVLPTEVMWPGRSGLGTWKLDDDLKSLVIQTSQVARLVQLGEVKATDTDLKISMEFLPQTESGSFGLFFGYQAQQSEKPQYSRFQAIHIQMIPSVGRERRILVCRYLGRLDGVSGRIAAENSSSQMISVPRTVESLDFKVCYRRGSLFDVRVCDHDCFELVTSHLNAVFPEATYHGPFGLFATDATVWLNKPIFERNSP